VIFIEKLMLFPLQSNILIDGKGEPLLADFGLSFLDIELTGKSYFTSCKPGNVRWAAPELLIPLQDGSMRRACVKSDIYSVGCVMLQVSEDVMSYYRYVKSATQVLSGCVPYHIWNDFVVISEKFKGQEPLRIPEVPIDDGHWEFMRRCWRQKKERTVTVKEIATFIKRELEDAKKFGRL
jgi:serine/threonine protein kinase